MGSVVHDFSSLPSQDDADWIATYQAVFAQLTVMALATPVTPPDQTDRADLLTFLQFGAGSLIRSEVLADPLSIGYAGNTSAEISNLLNTWQNPDERTLGDGSVRISIVWAGFPFAPNVITEADVIGALG